MQTAKVFKSGNSQAIRLPKDFQFKDSEVYIKKMGNCVVIIPKQDPWKIVEESVGKTESSPTVTRPPVSIVSPFEIARPLILPLSC